MIDGTESGLFLSFEGVEGCGKTTQMRLLTKRLAALGLPVTENQEPGATSIGKRIRRILLDPANSEMAPETELLLMFSSRAQAAAEVILPALRRGDIVLSDRFTDSTFAYQGAGRRLGFELVTELHRLTLGSLWPHLTICVTLPVETGLSRAHRRNQTNGNESLESRLDRQALSFHQLVAQGYEQIAAREPQRFRLIDGAGDPSQVSDRIWSVVAPLVHGRFPAKVLSA